MTTAVFLPARVGKDMRILHSLVTDVNHDSVCFDLENSDGFEFVLAPVTFYVDVYETALL